MSENETNGNGTQEETQEEMAAVLAELIELPEAPASWNVRYYDALGFECQLTLRGHTPGGLLPRTEAATKWLVKHGCVARMPRGNGNAPASNGGGVATKICPIHSVEMRQRHGQGGDSWYSHKAVNPETGQEFWCRGKA